MSRAADEAFEMTAGAFGAMVLLTVAPVVPGLIYLAFYLWGSPGGWSSIAFLYLGVPLLAGAITYLTYREGN